MIGHSDPIARLAFGDHHYGFFVECERAPRGASRSPCPVLASRIPHCVSNIASQNGVQVSKWTELPREVIEIVLKNISQDDLWTCRDVSTRWATAAKASGLLKLVTSLSPCAGDEVPVKLARLHQLEICHSQVQCCLKVELPDTAACAALLEPLTDQVILTGAQLHLLTIDRHSGALGSCCQTSLCSEVAQDISCCRASNYLNAGYWLP